jgi:hypothetical protein
MFWKSMALAKGYPSCATICHFAILGTPKPFHFLNIYLLSTCSFHATKVFHLQAKEVLYLQQMQ